jgi:hypothetical protein
MVRLAFATRAIGWRLRTDMREGMERLIAWRAETET